MKSKYLVFLFAVTLSASAFSQTSYQVPEDYLKISDAIQAAPSGTTVEIGPGIYDRNTQDFPIILKDGVSVTGQGYAQTFIDPSGTGAPAFTADGVVTTDTLLSHFTVENGNLIASGGAAVNVTNCAALFLRNMRFRNNSGINGGAVYIGDSTVFIRDCIFSGNSADNGGAIYIEGAASAPLVVLNEFELNSASDDGGGIFVANADNSGFYRNTFSGNSAAANGGGAFISGCSPEFFTNTLKDNSALRGGGLALDNSSPEIQRNRFLRNAADYGAGIYSNAGSSVIYNNTFDHNTANISGSGFAANSSSDIFLNNVAHHNTDNGASGASIFLENSNTEITQNTISHNDSFAAIALQNSSVPFYNNIVSFNEQYGLYELDASSDPDCQYNLFYENASGNYVDEGSIVLNTGPQINSASNGADIPFMNIVGDPAFEDALSADFHIRPISAARETGTDSPPTFAEQDMDVEVRSYAYSGSNPDIGADELTYPHVVEPVVYYDVDQSDNVTSGDQLILTFNREMDSPTTVTAADFFLPVLGDSIGPDAEIQVPAFNPRQVIIQLGTGASLSIEDQFEDSNTAPGDPSGIDISSPRSDGLQDKNGLPAYPLGLPGPNYTGTDIDKPCGTGEEYAYWFSTTYVDTGAAGYYNHTLEVPIYSSYYSGFITMRPPEAYMGTSTAVKFEGTYPLFIFDSFKPATITMSYSEAEIDEEAGQREQDMRIFRLNANNPDDVHFELVPDAWGGQQTVDTENNKVSVSIVYLYPPLNSEYESPVKIPFDAPMSVSGKGVYAVFPVSAFDEYETAVSPGSYSDSVSVSTASDDLYDSHEAEVSGFYRDDAGTVTLKLRPATYRERELFPESSHAVFVVEALEQDGVTPFDIDTTASVSINYRDRLDEVMNGDVVDVNGNKGSEPQLRVDVMNPETWTLEQGVGVNLIRNPVNNILWADIPPTAFHNGRAIIGCSVDWDIPFQYTFFFSDEDWDFFSDFDEFDAGFPGRGAGFISIASTSNYTYSFWSSDPDEVPVMEDYLYRARFPVETNIFSQQTCPSFRLRVNSQNGQLGPMVRLISSGDAFALPTTQKLKTYDMYFKPPESSINAEPDEDDLQFSLEMINLDENDTPGVTLFYNGVDIERIPLSSLATSGTLAAYEFNGSEDGWVPGSAYPEFTAPEVSSTPQSLYLGVMNTNTFGFWTRDTGIPITTGTLYCATFTIYSDAPARDETPDMRFRVNTESFSHTAMLRVENSGNANMSPMIIPREYKVYFYPDQGILEQDELENIVLSVDIINLSDKAERGTGIYIDRVVLESLVPPS